MFSVETERPGGDLFKVSKLLAATSQGSRRDPNIHNQIIKVLEDENSLRRRT